MKILVTGRDGQVARSLAERHGKHQLVFAARPDLDLADAASIERTVAAVNPDLVISAAAYTAVDKAEDEPELAMAVNGTAPGILAHAAAKAGAPVVHLSTDYVFDGSLDRPWREDDPVAPLGVYGRTKLLGEDAVSESGATHAILRTAWVYSSFGNNFVKTMLRLAETRDTLNVVDDQYGCPTSAVDIADGIMAIVAAWENEPARGRNAVYHLAGTGATNWADFARAIFAASAGHGGATAEVCGIPSSEYRTRAMRPANSRLDCARFERVFGWQAPRWEESLDRVVGRLTAST